MPRCSVLIMLGLAACGVFDMGQEGDLGSGDMRGWRSASGKPLSRAEYAAIVAACQDGAVRRTASATLDTCLAELGLKRAE